MHVLSSSKQLVYKPILGLFCVERGQGCTFVNASMNLQIAYKMGNLVTGF